MNQSTAIQHAKAAEEQERSRSSQLCEVELEAHDEKLLRLAPSLRSTHLGMTSSSTGRLMEAREYSQERPQNHRRLIALPNEAAITGKRLRESRYLSDGLLYAAWSAEKRPPLRRYRRTPQA